MGMTPVSGIMMCARAGDLDPSIVTFLMKKENLSADEIENILNKLVYLAKSSTQLQVLTSFL